MAELRGPRGMAPQNDAPSRIPFPQTPDQFEQDTRVSYSKLDNKWILEDVDGSEWEFEESLGKWMPSLDETLLEQQQQAYIKPGADVEESTPASLKKRKKEQDDAGYDASKKARGSKDQPKAERKNTAVYVTSLPLDVTVAELHDVFSKYGIIAEEVDSGKPRIKLYTDDVGKPKGDALIVYFRPESVRLAIQMLDDSDFRLGEKGPDGPMKVKEAEFSYKKQQDGPKQQNTKDKKKIIKRTQKLNNKLADWDDDDPQTQPETSSRWDKVVILKHMFTLGELAEDAGAKTEIQEDISEECGKLGEVIKVTLFDKEADGVVSVRFGTPQAADACVRLMKGRHFGGQQVEAYISDGTERFKKTSEKKSRYDDDDENNRLDEFGAWLENDGEGEVGGGEEVR